MLEPPPAPAPWRRFRRQQALGAVVTGSLGVLGALTFGGESAGRGLALLVACLFLCGFGTLLATSRSRGARGVRLRVIDGHAVTEFAAHVPSGVLAAGVVALLLAGVLWLLAWLASRAAEGSVIAGFAGLLALGLLGWLGWTLNRLPLGHRGLGAVRLDPTGVEVTGPLRGSQLGWDRDPVPVPWTNGVLRLVPRARLEHLAASPAERRRDQWRAAEGWIGPAGVDADLAVVAAAVEYYRAHPERRMELTTPAATERIRAGGLLPPWGADA